MGPAAQDVGEVAAGFGEQMVSLERTAHHIHHGDGRQDDVDHRPHPRPHRRGRRPRPLCQPVDDVSAEGPDRWGAPPLAQLGQRQQLGALGRARPVGGLAAQRVGRPAPRPSRSPLGSALLVLTIPWPSRFRSPCLSPCFVVLSVPHLSLSASAVPLSLRLLRFSGSSSRLLLSVLVLSPFAAPLSLAPPVLLLSPSVSLRLHSPPASSFPSFAIGSSLMSSVPLGSLRSHLIWQVGRLLFVVGSVERLERIARRPCTYTARQRRSSSGGGVVQARGSERHWINAWHVPLNVAAMHVSGVLLLISLCWVPAVTTATYGQVFGLGIWILMIHVAIQIPAGLLASRWAVRGQVVRAGLVALGLATAAVWTLYLCAGQERALWWRTSGCLCVSLSSYVWLCTLRRSTAQRLAERFKYSAQTLAIWALLRPPRRGPH
ncbi:hypothetical protein QFZ58_006732 [Streptomyces sp. B1I3]|nr:hypothetical protein [Streptomyces sp. B1I3]